MTIPIITLTNLTSKFGILSRKAAIRLSTETGKKLVDKSREIGRVLNKEEVESVFVQILPKKCCPKIITTKTEVANILRKQDLTESQIAEQINMPYIGAATILNGRKKCPIWIPFENFEKTPELQPFANSLIAHELEHALEKNHKISEIIKRKMSDIKKFLGQLFDKNYIERIHRREMEIHKFEQEVHKSVLPSIDKSTGLLTCEPTVEAIDTLIKSKKQKGLLENLREIMRRDYAGGANQGSEPNKRLKLMKYWMDLERPAYEVTGEIDRYTMGLSNGQNSVHTAISKSYEGARRVAKQERKDYWKNKLLGRLRKPNVYVNDKDILSYARNNEEKNILTSLLDKLDNMYQKCLNIAKTEEKSSQAIAHLNFTHKQRKTSLLKFLYAHEDDPKTIKTISEFIENTEVNGNNIYLTHLGELRDYSLDFLINPDVVEIAKIANSKPENFAILNNIIYLFSLLPDSKQINSWSTKVKEIVKNNIDAEEPLRKLANELEESFPKAFTP